MTLGCTDRRTELCISQKQAAYFPSYLRGEKNQESTAKEQRLNKRKFPSIRQSPSASWDHFAGVPQPMPRHAPGSQDISLPCTVDAPLRGSRSIDGGGRPGCRLQQHQGGGGHKGLRGGMTSGIRFPVDAIQTYLGVAHDRHIVRVPPTVSLWPTRSLSSR